MQELTSPDLLLQEPRWCMTCAMPFSESMTFHLNPHHFLGTIWPLSQLGTDLTTMTALPLSSLRSLPPVVPKLPGSLRERNRHNIPRQFSLQKPDSIMPYRANLHLPCTQNIGILSQNYEGTLCFPHTCSWRWHRPAPTASPLFKHPLLRRKLFPVGDSEYFSVGNLQHLPLVKPKQNSGTNNIKSFYFLLPYNSDTLACVRQTQNSLKSRSTVLL